MFTGIIEELGEILSSAKRQSNIFMDIASNIVSRDLKLGDSIAVNGVCLTAVDVREGSFSVEAVSETLERSNLSELKAGDKINLERAMKADGRLGGHIVAGHVDALGKILKKESRNGSVEISVSFPEGIRKYLIKKGSVAIDGISLTIADVSSGFMRLAVIPHTLAQTTLGIKKTGDSVNIEVDVIGKYVEKNFTREQGGEKKRVLNLAMY